MRRVITGVCALALGVTAAACGENEVATAHIRMVVDSAQRTEGSPVVALPNGDTMRVRESVVEFYRSRGYVPAWTDDDEILPRGLALLESLGKADREGLDRERYHYSTAHEMARLLGEDAVEDRELEYLGNLDLMLSESFARLSQDVVAGTLEPEKAGLDWEIERGEVADRELIESVLAGRDPVAVLDSLRPRVPYYDRLTTALARLREVEQKGGWGTIDEGETLKPGDSHPRVAQLRARLMRGADPDEARLAGEGRTDMQKFDDALAKAVEHFQKRHTLHEDGALGPKTLAALNVPVENRIESVRLNLDKWRWLPNELGERFILVNVAGFELEVVDGEKVVESMNVVVGKTANRTPIFRDTLEYMVVNPYWNVPRSIAREEIFPIAARDPGYMDRNNYELVRNGNVVSMAALSYDAVSSGSVMVRQRPGPSNALGNVKFLFPNDMNIYLHDTPADHLFTQQSRAFSHGCIRVERPDDLARTLLGMLTDRDPDDYDALRKRQGEQWIEMDEKIPVYILYFTAWADEDGTVRFHEDIYDRDRSLEQEAEDKLTPVTPRPITVESG